MATKDVERHYGSLLELVEAAKAPLQVSDRDESARTSRKEAAGREKFSGTRTFAEAVTLAHGWREGAERIERMASRLTPKGVKNRRIAVMSEVGPGSYSMGALNAGHPQPFVVLRDTQTPRNGKGKVVRLVVNCSASFNVPASVIERRGAAVLALCVALERANRRVEIEVLNCTTPGRRVLDRLTYRVTLKRAEQKTNLLTLAFALAHPSFLRRLIFAVKENDAPEVVTKWHGLGTKGIPADPREVPANTVFLAKMSGSEPQWDDDESAEAWVIEELAKQGVTLK